MLAAALGLACAGLAPAQGIPPDPPAQGPEEVRLGYFANVTHAQAILAVDSGDFARAIAPARLSTRLFNAGPALVEALFGGEIDIAYVGPSPALNAHRQSRGRAIRVIAGAAANGVVIVAGPGSGIESLADLRGRRIATPQLGNTQDVSARHYIVKVLGQGDADNVIPVPSAEQVSMMLRRQIDASWAVEPWGARLVAEAGGKIIAEEKDLWPDGQFALTLIVTSPEFLAKHPGTVEQVLEVHCAWTARLLADAPGQVPGLTTALGRLTGKKLSEEVIGSAVSRVRFTDDPLPQSLATFARWALDLRLTRGMPPVATLTDTSLLEKVRARRDSAPRPTTSRPGKP